MYNRLAVELPEFEKMVQAALRDGMPGVAVFSDLEENSVDRFPALMHSVSGSGMSENRLGVWPFSLQLSAFALEAGKARDTARAAHRVVTSWSLTKHLPGMGGLRFEGVQALPSEVRGMEKSVIGKPARQWTAIYYVAAFNEAHFHNA